MEVSIASSRIGSPVGSPTDLVVNSFANGQQRGHYKSSVRSMDMQHKQQLVLRAKVVVVGDACVGKTAISQMFNSGGHNYPKNYIMVRYDHSELDTDTKASHRQERIAEYARHLTLSAMHVLLPLMQTIGVDFTVKQVSIPDTNCAVELYLFDCAGQGIFNKVSPSCSELPYLS